MHIRKCCKLLYSVFSSECINLLPMPIFFTIQASKQVEKKYLVDSKAFARYYVFPLNAKSLYLWGSSIGVDVIAVPSTHNSKRNRGLAITPSVSQPWGGCDNAVLISRPRWWCVRLPNERKINECNIAGCIPLLSEQQLETNPPFLEHTLVTNRSQYVYARRGRSSRTVRIYLEEHLVAHVIGWYF